MKEFIVGIIILSLIAGFLYLIFKGIEKGTQVARGKDYISHDDKEKIWDIIFWAFIIIVPIIILSMS